MFEIKNYIGGRLAGPVSESYLDNYNPATGEVYSLIPDSDARDVELAAEAARYAFDDWSKTSAEGRHDVLARLAGLIERDLDKLAKAESIDNGSRLRWQKQWISRAR
jgi:aminomuconate-semialdehyde/2-hydroxymuconate-6-semialdehyde dehydrogenase